MAKEKGRQWDGKSRPSTDLYKKNFDRIFKTNPVAKEVRTPKYKSQVINNKKKEKTLHEMAMEGYEEEKRMYEEE
jgi:hypothetical protein